jgi:serine/threonine protein phosphatase PrpC
VTNPLQFTHGLATQGPWVLAWACQAGTRHLTHGKPCEDSVAHRFHGAGAVAIALADGISGGAAGDAASAAAVRYCTDFADALPTDSVEATQRTATRQAQTTLWDDRASASSAAANHPQLQTYLNALDNRVQAAVAQHSDRAGATTLAAAWLNADGSGWLSHLGDVRAYVYTGVGVTTDSSPPARCTLQPITRDHTYANAGEVPPHQVAADNPNRMAGNGFAGTPPLQALHLELGQCLLLCSDGLHGFVDDAGIAKEMARLRGPATSNSAAASVAKTAASVARRLLKRAVAAGSDDDIAVQLLCYAPNQG